MDLFKTRLQYFAALMLLTFSMITNAQDLRNLDQVKQISIFKFSSDTSYIKEREAKISTAEEMKNVKYYRYTGDSLKTFYGIPVDEVLIYYYKNKLFRIDINFGTKTKEYTQQAYDQVQQQLEKIYGSDKTKLAMSGALLLGGSRWESEKVQLDHTRHSYPQKRKKDNAIYGGVSFSDMSLSKAQILEIYGKYAPKTTPQQQTYVLVHGAWGGGWAFKKTDSIMSGHGNEIHRASLTGQGERVHLSSPDIDLKTHIKDVVNMILYDKLENVVLVGHSYGGMVITGVADSIPQRIRKLVFLDAILPNDGESLVSSRGPGGGGPELSAKDGFMVPEWVRTGAPAPKDVPQSLKTFTQPVSFNNPAALKIPATYILTVDPGQKPENDGFYFYGERAKKRGYKYLIMSADHNPQFNRSEELAAMLEKE